MDNTLTERQQRYLDIITEEENATKYRTISPGICGSCDECQSAYGLDEAELTSGVETGDICDEGGFSWHDCELCGSPLGGDRYAAHGWSMDDELIHYDICPDCLFTTANGDVPDDEYLDWLN